jgi:hypothetical protein
VRQKNDHCIYVQLEHWRFIKPVLGGICAKRQIAMSPAMSRDIAPKFDTILPLNCQSLHVALFTEKNMLGYSLEL